MATDVVSFRAGKTLGTELAAMANRAGVSISEAARSTLAGALIQPRPTYGPSSPYSFVADSWRAASEFDADAVARLRGGAAVVEAAATFAGNTGNLSSIRPPGYQPIAIVADGDRPLRNLTTQLPLADSQPFTVPALTTGTAVADHVELTNPTAGALAIAGGTVSPRGFSGAFSITREVVDSANPALDALALSVMSESYIGKTETVVYAELATPPASATVTAAVLPAELRKQIGRVTGARRRRAAGAVVSAADAVVDACTVLPAANSGSAIGLDETTGDAAAPWHVQGVPVTVSADLGSTSGSVIGVITSSDSIWSWESPTKTFRFDERSGPGLVEVALYGFFACRLLRPAGARVIKLT